MSTSDRILDAATDAFGLRGYNATSLDALARDLDVRKQTVLYHFGSKDGLLEAVVDRAAGELSDALSEAVDNAPPALGNVEAVVRATFRLALRRPELLGLVRELSRLGDPWVGRAVESLEPMVKRATEFLEAEMEAGRMRRSDSRLLLVSVYSTVMGVATEVEILRAFGVELTLRTAARRRKELIVFLHSALAPAE
ncbi:MAG: TetR/AcrR family transcriptional regulator [Acidimicrobiia bacterium]|nr:TetR/AcrR family transcriptional regulator [Acidimicrobiia bacterium]